MKRTTTKIRNVFIATAVALAFRLHGVYSFQSVRIQSSFSQTLRCFALFGEKSSSENLRRKDKQEGEEFLFGSGSDLDYIQSFPSDDQIFSSLNSKVKELELGIGKRYIIRTQRGFLNVHYEVRRYSSGLCWTSSSDIRYVFWHFVSKPTANVLSVLHFATNINVYSLVILTCQKML